MKTKINLFIFTFFLFVTLSVFSQNIQKVSSFKFVKDSITDFYHLKTPGNTEQNSIPYMAQDSIGYMWFATKDGLIKYNGKGYKIYKYDPKNKHSVGGIFIERIFVGKDGSVWVGTEPAVLSKYHPETDDFETIDGIEGARIKGIQQDSNGLYWITSDRALYSYDDTTKKLQSFEIPEVNFDRLLITKDDRIFISTNKYYILEFFVRTKKFKRIKLMNEGEVIHHKKTAIYTAFHLVEDYKGYLWITTPYKYLLRYDLKNNQLEKFIIPKASYSPKVLDWKKLTIMFIFEDNEHNLWFGTWFNGMYKINENRTQITHFKPNSKNPNGLTNNIVHSGMQDKAGYLWFGTEFTGINILKKNKKFKILSHNNTKNSFPTAPQTCVAVDAKNRVWVGTEWEGLYYFNKNQPDKIFSDSGIIEQIDYNFIGSLLIDSKGFLWIGTNNGLYKHNLATKQTLHYKYKKDSYNNLISNEIISIIEDKDHIIWIGTNKGLTKFDTEKNKFYHFVNEKDNPKSLSNNIVRTLYCDAHNDIWVGTFSGLNKLNKKTGDFTVYKHNYGEPDGISADRINSIYGTNKQLWIGTQGGGLNLYDYKSKKFKAFYKKNGFISDNVKGITGDQNANLWITTSKNILKFNPKTFEYITYSASDGLENSQYINESMGLQDLQFIQGFSATDKEGFVYFGGISGMTFFHPDSLPQNNFKPQIVLDAILVNGNKYKNKGKIELKSDENQLEFKTTTLNYIQPDKNQYAFYLENYDSIWHYQGNKSNIIYYNLPSGTYKFHYKGANNDGVWNTETTALEITILPPFYKTKTFYSILIILFLLLILSFLFYRYLLFKKIQRQKEKMRYSKSNLTKNEVETINQLLFDKLQTGTLYLEPDLTLHKLAKSIGVSPNKLSQVINQVHQRNFNEYINLYRIEEAKKLLKKTTFKIEAVAYDSGFNSLSTFNAVFKKETGITPSKYRKQQLQ